MTSSFSLAIHGGAGTLRAADQTAETEAAYRNGLAHALRAGQEILQSDGSALDAVCAAVRVLEDDPLFNAGRGAVFTHEGSIELDAAVMDGASGRAGAVAGVGRIRNPVLAARAAMEHTRHVLLIGAGAERFAAEHGIEMVSPEYFHTRHRWEQLQKAKAEAAIMLDHDGARAAMSFEPWKTDNKFGTVGAVARDRAGCLAAATSTGGLTNKFYGRVGDSPIVGAGTYADGRVAVSGTGVGEFFMRGLLAYDIAARMKYRASTLSEAVNQAIGEVLTAKGGQGGVIAIDVAGNVEFGFNTEGMYRGCIREGGEAVTAIYRQA
ncbi:MAG TPA: isoaspartyl peptidase/L-asparaginase [Burkholderiaceae bacterium]